MCGCAAVGRVAKMVANQAAGAAVLAGSLRKHNSKALKISCVLSALETAAHRLFPGM